MAQGRILVVDDEAIIRDVLSKLLALKGHQVETAASAEEAFALLDKGRFDLVLIDVVLPGMTGLGAIAEIRGRSKAAVIAMSGHCDEELRKDALLLGARDLLGKPMEMPQLDAAIQAALAGVK